MIWNVKLKHVQLVITERFTDTFRLLLVSSLLTCTTNQKFLHTSCIEKCKIYYKLNWILIITFSVCTRIYMFLNFCQSLYHWSMCVTSIYILHKLKGTVRVILLLYILWRWMGGSGDNTFAATFHFQELSSF